MRLKKIVRKFWRDIDARRWDNLASYFSKGARVDWPNTGESFDQDGFRDAKSADQGYWAAEVEKVVRAGKLVVSVAKVRNNAASFHVTSFFTFRGKKILSLLEYWGEDGRLYRRHVKNVPEMIEAASALPADGGEDIDKVQPSLPNQAHEARQDSKPRQIHKEADIVTMPKTVKKSAWTRLFFPDDAV